MRKILFDPLIAMLVFCTSMAQAEQNKLLLDRGFQEKKCFSHPAIRRCSGGDCVLEVFPDSNGKLSLELDDTEAALKSGNPSIDYGIFSFELISAPAEGIPNIRIISIERVPLEKWDSVKDKSFKAHLIPCAN